MLHISRLSGSGGALTLEGNHTVVGTPGIAFVNNAGTSGYLGWANNGATDSFYFSGGNVGIGKAAPRGRLEVVYGIASPTALTSAVSGGMVIGDGGGVGAQIGIVNISNNYSTFIQARQLSAGGAYNLLLNPLGGNVGINNTSPSYKLDVNGTIRGYGITDSSDIRWKKNITTLGKPLDKIIQLRGVCYEWNQEDYPDKDFGQGPQIGIVAQELEAQYPELIDTDEEGYKSIQYGKFTAVLLEAIKEQQRQIQVLRQDIEQLERNL